MKKMKKLLAVVLAFSATVTMSMPQDVQAAVKLSRTKLTLEVGKSQTLKLTGTKQKIRWTSSKKTVATVNSKGKVTAKSAGTTTITAKYGKAKKTCKVTVKAAPVTLKNPIVEKKYPIAAQGKYCLRVKNTNDKAVQMTVVLNYLDEYGMQQNQEKLIPVVDAGETVIVEYDAKLRSGTGANVGFKDVKEISKNLISKKPLVKKERVALERNNTTFKITNTSDTDLEVVEVYVFFLDSRNTPGGCATYRIENLKAGAEETIVVDVPAHILGYKYNTLTYINYAYSGDADGIDW